MNREIKFRVFDIQYEEIIYNPFHFEVIPNSHSIYWKVPRDFEHGYNNDCVVMQYSGVKTKSGVDIYEGDIWLDSSGMGVIIFHEGRFGIKWHIPGAMKDIVGDLHAHAITTSGKVIGNIYENSELLK